MAQKDLNSQKPRAIPAEPRPRAKTLLCRETVDYLVIRPILPNTRLALDLSLEIWYRSTIALNNTLHETSILISPLRRRGRI